MNPSERIRITPLADGVVRIGEPPMAATEVAQVPLAGVTLIVDPSDTEPAAHALVYDMELAAPMLDALFGSPVVEALRSGANDTVEREPSDELAEFEHLGRLLWLEDTRPVPIEPSLLDLEIIVESAELIDHDALVDNPRVIMGLTAMARQIRETPSLPLAAELRDLFQRALPHLPFGGPGSAEVDHERELMQVEDRWGSAALTGADLAWLRDQLATQPATRLGGVGTSLTGVASIDWRRVPRSVLPAAESAIRFAVHNGSVEVTVPGPVASRPHPAIPAVRSPMPSLVASLRSSAWPVPLAEGLLEYQADGAAWTGFFPIAPEAVDLAREAPVLDVDVRSVVLGWKAPNLREARQAAARRWAARGIEARRLAAVAQDSQLDETGAGALRYAARLWSAVGAPARAERCRELAGDDQGLVVIGLAEQWLLRGR